MYVVIKFTPIRQGFTCISISFPSSSIFLQLDQKHSLLWRRCCQERSKMNSERTEWTSRFVFQIKFFFIFKAGTITSSWKAFHYQGSSILKNQKLNFEGCQDEYICHRKVIRARPYELLHTRLPYLSLSPGVSQTSPLSWWCHCNVMIHGLLMSDYNIEKNKHSFALYK